ncbi:hypothetical protein SteCoe_14857 [Stentor coeruleus]|uniref:non-specific serine/threonine protein kinase n=1 Tax=Stentor coeruleus TaxID=5963 RepID=A0A1R2C502_9CILI|nr:hypothetical protein SteCoe_14857 [Stentor coeruleus]
MDEASMSNEDIPDDSSSVVYDDEEEPASDYRPGGYHPVQPNELFLNRYHIVQKVGWGHFSTVWLCKDTKYNTFVAMKVQKSASNYAEAAYDEIDILMKVSSNCSLEIWKKSITKYLPNEGMQELENQKRSQCFVVQLLNSFIHTGPNGKHVCMVFEILGVNLLEIIKRYNYKGIPMPICRVISKQILIGLDYLHRICGIIHTDLKPENVLLQLTKAQINEIIKFGMLKTKVDCEPMKKTPMPIVSVVKELNIPEPRRKSKEEKPLPQPAPKIEVNNEPEIEKKTEPEQSEIEITDPGQDKIEITDPEMLKKIKKAEKKKNYRLRKKQAEKKLKEENPEAVVPKKKKKKRNKKNKKNKQNEGEQNKEDKKSEDDENEENKEKDIESVENSHNIISKEENKHDIEKEEKYEIEEEEKHEIEEEEKIHAESDSKLHEQLEIKVDEENNEDKDQDKNPVNENIRVKIADLGNGCWVDNHFATEIQTRQYRGPEVIIGISYNHTADLWSFACMLFELITGDFLFEPRTGKDFDKDDDHLAQMVETLGFFPKSFSLSGVNSKKYFTIKGELRRIKQLRIWPLKNVLLEKYRIKEEEASALASFLLPMLVYEPAKRATAEQMLGHFWLDMPNNYNIKMTEKEFWEMSLVQKQREVDNNERLKRGESPIIEGVRLPSSNENTDIEDNNEISQESDFSASDNEKEFIENLEYHQHMNQIKQKLLSNSHDI